MSEHNNNTLNMYNNGGAKEYIQNFEIDPEEIKWLKLFNYIQTQINSNKEKRIVEFGSGGGQIAIMLQTEGYNVTATDAVDDFLEEQSRIGIKQVKKFNFLTDDFDQTFDSKADLIISWRNPHLDMDDMKKLFQVAHNGLSDDGLLIINFQNSEMHPNAETLPNNTKYEYKILADKQTTEKRFYAYFSKEDIDYLMKDLFEINEYHTEGGKENKNWHVLTLKKRIKNEI